MRRAALLVASVLLAAPAVLLMRPDAGAQVQVQVQVPTAEPLPVAPTGVGSVAELEPAVGRSVERAVTAAAAEGVELRVTSGRRSRQRQQALYEAAIDTYGSPEQARRWVLPPGESAP